MAANGESRPDPDALIERIRGDDRKAARGRLRIYFGSSAGVGKTWAMLAGARAAMAAGVDVVAGVVETHGRADTAAQLAGTPMLAKRQAGAAGTTALEEFDLDAALARMPALILVDELAHSNVTGSRHPKRWQDVEELLAAGIDVWTTLNVQHLESLNDVVGGITGVRVQETLPDTFFDRADEVVLVDTPAEELLARLRAGKVYGAAQAERAAANFFRKGNLMALRELALRRTADRVEDDVQAYRADRAIGRVWKTEAAILCCIGPGENGEHTVRSAALLAQQLAVSFHAVYVETPALQRLADAGRERILKAVKLAGDMGATTQVLPAANVAAAVVAHARQHNLSRIVLGRSPAGFWRRNGTLAQQLGRLAPDVDLIEIGAPAAAVGASRRAAGDAAPVARRFEPAGYLVAGAACALLTLATLPLGPILDTANIVMLFLLAVLGVALRYGRGPAALASVLNVVAFDFFFVPPKLSFAVADIQYLLTFGVMLAVGLIVGQLTAGLRYQARVATHRERRSNSLFEVARDLSSVLATEQVVEAAEKAVAREFRGAVHIFVLDAGESLQSFSTPTVPGVDAGSARWAFDHAQPAGLGTDTLPGSRWLYLPLKAPMRTRGVLALRPEATRLLLVPEQRRQLETFAALTAIALERVHYVEVAQQATLQIESERLRNSLLGALSHDLRTPLAGLVGLTESLRLTRPPLSAEQEEIAGELQAEALRMSTQVGNLLDMARIESGAVRLRRDWHSVEEIVGSAVRATARTLAPRVVTTDLAPRLPLVECDAVLIERVFVNLLENAAKYTPPSASIRVAARAAGPSLRIDVLDNGPGVRAGQEQAIFDKFTRGARESAIAGVGLGLAICKAIVEAHGGTIEARPAPGGGADFGFTLPLGTAPQVDTEPELDADADADAGADADAEPDTTSTAAVRAGSAG